MITTDDYSSAHFEVGDDTVKLLHYGRVVHFGRFVRSRILPRASLWKLLKNKLEGSREWQWDRPVGRYRYQEALKSAYPPLAKEPASLVIRGLKRSEGGDYIYVPERP